MTKKEGKITFLVLLTGVIALFHYAVPTDQHALHMIHIGLRKLYFLPPVIAAVWFGFRGSIYTTLGVTALLSLHAFLDWPGNYMEQANQMGELASFWVVGLIAGSLFDRERSLLRDLAKANEETLVGLVSALDLRERNPRLHSQRVKEYTLLLADRFGVAEEKKRAIGLGALLHDVGKIAVSDRILLKPGKLSDEEWMEMRKHPGEGYRLLKRISSLQEAAEIVHAHHEHFDGTGYPRGLKREEIPQGARLFAVADVFDALTTARPYRTAASYDEAARTIHEKSGVHFDPTVVKAFEGIQPAEWDAIRKRYAVDSGSW
ncbi:MAG: phosphohydrolase [Nitrospirae bacterium RBG_19FT_COMBO_55_12]|nr:MAG: phosphohydrolase [Nitrospirae bacterium RBG_19FT_COMBO_55_12]